MFNSSYFAEFRRNWRVLLAATLGLSAGANINQYAQAVFSSELLKDFGWTQSQFALVSLTTIPAFFLVPIVGRLTDVLGARRIVLPAIVLHPFAWLGYLLIDGSFIAYLVASIVHLVIGLGTASLVYSRFIAEHFLAARGLALSILMSGPAAVVAIGTPQLTRFINAYGWQPGFLAMASYSATVGAVAFLLLRRQAGAVPQVAIRDRARRTWADYAAILGSRAFWVIFVGLLLCNIANLLHASQISLMLVDRGASIEAAAEIISLYAVGVIVGRFACGFAVDHLPVVHVAVVTLILPSFGLLLLGMGVDSFWAMAFAMALVGLAQGAEGELLAMLALKYFKLDNFGTAISLLAINSIAATMIGSLTLSRSLAAGDGFSAFILLCAATTLVGSLLLTLLPTAARRDALLRMA